MANINIKMFFECMVKGVSMTLTMENGEQVTGQYELNTIDNKVCIFSDESLGYEYFEMDSIKSVLVKENE